MKFHEALKEAQDNGKAIFRNQDRNNLSWLVYWSQESHKLMLKYQPDRETTWSASNADLSAEDWEVTILDKLPVKADVFMCPRRGYEPSGVFNYPSEDYWIEDATGRLCNYCGSLHPDTFMEMVRAGVPVDPTDKNYKAYIGKRYKFYYQHLSAGQKGEFISLLNSGAMHIGYPKHFYVLPYFLSKIEE